MNLLKRSTAEHLRDYYDPLLTHQIKTILESGLLLDEDYEVLLKASNFKIYPDKSYKPSAGLITGGLAVLTSIVVAKRYNLPLLVVPSLGLSLAGLCWKTRSVLIKRRRRQATQQAVKSLACLQKLNATIIQYLKTRSQTSSNDCLMFNKNIEDFIKSYVEQYTDFFYYLINELEFLSALTSELCDDYMDVKQINIEGILNIDDLDDDYTGLASKLKDLHAFLTSKLLNYLGLTFGKILGDIAVKELECLLDNSLPKLTARSGKLHDVLRKEFNDLRYCALRKQNFVDKKSKGGAISGKLEQMLAGSINGLSVIMEKSQAVLRKAEELKEGDSGKEIESALTELRDHSLAIYESLDILCRLCGILSKEKSLAECTSNHKPFFEDQVTTHSTIHFDDTLEPQEENYELYIEDKENCYSDQEDKPKYEDPSSAYLGLMLRELKQSLKQHERFIAARAKRGIKDDDVEEIEHKKERSRKKTPPKFNLFEIRHTDTLAPDPIVSENKQMIPPPVPPPPPPPQPTPVFNLEELSQEFDLNDKRSLLENIKTLSNQIKTEEDIFGDEYSSDSD